MFYSKHWGALTKRLNNEICLEESPQPVNRPRYSRILTLNNLCASLCMSLTVQADWIPLYFSLSSFQSFFFLFAPRSNRKAKGKKSLFDWVLIWDCQTSRDDKVHTWEQARDLLCIFCCNQLCSPADVSIRRDFHGPVICPVWRAVIMWSQ